MLNRQTQTEQDVILEVVVFSRSLPQIPFHCLRTYYIPYGKNQHWRVRFSAHGFAGQFLHLSKNDSCRKTLRRVIEVVHLQLPIHPFHEQLPLVHNDQGQHRILASLIPLTTYLRFRSEVSELGEMLEQNFQLANTHLSLNDGKTRNTGHPSEVSF